MSPANAGRQRGFSLLETIVAMTMLATVGMALFGLFNGNLLTWTRAEAVAKQVPVVRHATEVLAAVNPMETQAGEFDVDGHRVRWSAELVEPKRRGQSARGEPTRYELGLYEITFRIHAERRPLGSWRLRQVGWRLAGAGRAVE